MKLLRNFVIALVLCAVLLYISFLSLQTLYISSDFLEGSTAIFPGVSMLRGYFEHGSFFNRYLGLDPITEVHVEKLTFFHALRNLAFVFGATSLSLLLIFIMAIVIPFIVIFGLVTGDWEAFGAGLLCIILIPLLVIVFIIGIAFFWLMAFFQASTPAYMFTWFIAGLPMILIGLASGSSPTIVVLAIYD